MCYWCRSVTAANPVMSGGGPTAPYVSLSDKTDPPTLTHPYEWRADLFSYEFKQTFKRWKMTSILIVSLEQQSEEIIIISLRDRFMSPVHLAPQWCEGLCRQGLNKHLYYPTQQNTSCRLSEEFKVFLWSVTKHYNFQEKASGQGSETYQNFTSWNLVLWE